MKVWSLIPVRRWNSSSGNFFILSYLLKLLPRFLGEVNIKIYSFAKSLLILQTSFRRINLLFLQDLSFLVIFKKATFWMLLYFLFDGLCWVLVGLLTSNKDTKFVMYASSFLNWVAFVLPTYLFIGMIKHTADFAWMILAIYNMLNFLVMSMQLLLFSSFDIALLKRPEEILTIPYFCRNIMTTLQISQRYVF